MVEKDSTTCFEIFKGNDNIESWNGFLELMLELGFEMDCEKSFEEYKNCSGYNLKEPHSKREQKRNNLYLLERAPVKVVGDYLLSHWRYLTHWANGYDGYDVDYLVRIIRILELKMGM